MKQQFSSEGRCERYYSTYGNVTPGAGGGPIQGARYDLPECQAWIDTRLALQSGQRNP
jgi:hypothetical protein